MAIGKNYSARIAVAFISALLTGTVALAADSRNGFDYSDALVPTEEVHLGGVPRDGIPAVHDPKFVAAAEADFMRDKERVLGVVRNGIAKAYPIKILDRHEVVNDKFGDESIVVSYTMANTELTIEWQEDEQYARALDSSGEEITTVIVYWFAWYAFHPDTEIFTAGKH